MKLNAKVVKMMALCGAAMFASGVLARDVTWIGAVSRVWDEVTDNWTADGGITTNAYQKGDSAYITDDTGTTMSAYNHGIYGDVIFNIANTFTLTDGYLRPGISVFEKRGAGTLTISPQLVNIYGPIRVKEGTLAINRANGCSALSDFATPSGTVFVVENGATLWVVERNSIGKMDSIKGSAANVHVKKGGTFALGPSLAGSHVANSVSNLWLDGGSLTINGKSQDYIGVLDTVKFTGDTPYVLDGGANFTASTGGWVVYPHKPTEFNVPDLSGDAAVDVTLAMPFRMYKEMQPAEWANKPCGFRKTGAGRMAISYVPPSNADGMAPDGDVFIDEGVLEYNQSKLIRGASQTFTVNTNATLRFNVPGVLSGGITNENGQYGTRFVIDHGTLEVGGAVATNGLTYLGDELILDHATFSMTMNGGNHGALSFGRLVSFLGDTPYTLNPFSGMVNADIKLSSRPATELRVPDITGDDATDVTLGYTLQNYYSDLTALTTPGGLIKTGSGTLQLTALSSYEGDMEIREGTVLLDVSGYSSSLFGYKSTYLGYMAKEGRTVTVSTNGTLIFAQRNMLGSYGYGETGGNVITSTFVVDGGKVKFIGNNSQTAFGPMVYRGGTFEYADNTSPCGPFNFLGTFKVEGTTPLVLPSVTYNSRLSLYPNFGCAFDVEDVTGDGAVDFDCGLSISRCWEEMYYNGSVTNNTTKLPYIFTYGFTKKGAGTMALNRSEADEPKGSKIRYNFDDEARIQAGTILVNADYSTAGPWVVSAGAALGGTGKVNEVRLAEGAGFSVVANQAKALTITGDIALPETGTIKIHVPDGAFLKHVQAPIFNATGKVTGLSNLSNWAVEVDGETSTHFVVDTTATGASIRYLCGTCIYIR